MPNDEKPCVTIFRLACCAESRRYVQRHNLFSLLNVQIEYTRTKMDTYSSIHFLERSEIYKWEKPWGLHYSYLDWPAGVDRGNFICDERIVKIEDLRGQEHKFTFDRHGFAVIEMESSMLYDDFSNRNKIREVYCKELNSCLVDYLGASTVQIFDTQASSLTR